jgi:hypothetical protein
MLPSSVARFFVSEQENNISSFLTKPSMIEVILHKAEAVTE